MNLLRSLIVMAFLIIIFVPLGLLAQTENLAPVLGESATKNNRTTSEQVPNLLELLPNWWNYFEIDSEKFSTKVNIFLTHIDALSKTVSDEQKTTTNENITRIRASLKALSQIKKTLPKPIPEQTPFKEEYSLEALQKLERSLRDLESINKTELSVFKYDQKATKAMARKVDTLYVAYKKLDASSHDKLVAGLEIMASRLAWFVSTLNEPTQRKQLEIEDVQIKRLNEEIEYILAHLAITENELNTISNEIDKQQASLKQAQKRFINAQNQILEFIEDDLISNFKASLLKQKSLLAKILFAREETHLNYLQAKKSVAILILKKPEVSTDEIVERYKERDILLKKLRGQNETWDALFRKELDILVETKSSKENFSEDLKDAYQIFSDRKNVARETAVALRELGSSINDLSFLNSAVGNILTETQGPLFKFRSNSAYTFDELWKGTQSLFNKSLFKVGVVPVTAFEILRALIIILIAYFVSSLVRKILIRMSGPSGDRTSPVFYTLGRLSHYLILTIGLIIALASIGLNFTNLAIVAGALSVGIGFGLQSIVNNFVSGIILLFEQNIKVGDLIELDTGVRGTVRGIHGRSTIITTLDNLDVIVPNSELVTAKVTNVTMNEPMFRMHVPFGVAYGSDKKVVEKAVLEAAKQVEVTYDDGAKRRTQVWLVGFGDNSLNFELVVWVVNKVGAHAAPGSWEAHYNWEIETALGKYGIHIPFPQRDLHLKSGFVDT